MTSEIIKEAVLNLPCGCSYEHPLLFCVVDVQDGLIYNGRKTRHFTEAYRLSQVVDENSGTYRVGELFAAVYDAMDVGKPNEADLGPHAEGAVTANAVTGGVSPSHPATKTAAQLNTESYNAAPTAHLSNITPLDIRIDQLLMAQNPNVASAVNTDVTVLTVITPESTPTQPTIRVATEGSPVPIQAETSQTTTADPESAQLIEEFNADVEGRKPNLAKTSATHAVDINDVSVQKTESSYKHSPWYEKRKHQLQKNKKQGDAYENRIALLFNLTHLHSQKQITIKTANGFRIRVDLIGVDPKTGRIVIEEVKSSSTARFTKNQIDGFPDLMKEGGVVVGKGKGRFKGGTVIPARTDIFVRRPNEYKRYEYKENGE